MSTEKPRLSINQLDDALQPMSNTILKDLSSELGKQKNDHLVIEIPHADGRLSPQPHCSADNISKSSDQREQGTIDRKQHDEKKAPVKRTPLQKNCYDFFELHTTIWSKLFMAVSYMCILVTVVIVNLSTLPEFTTEDGQGSTLDDRFFYFEVFAALWWTIELIGNFIGSSNRVMFFTKFSNIIDVLSILPIVLFTISNSTVIAVAKVLSVLRLLKIYKLAQYNIGVKIGLRALMKSFDAILMLLIYIMLSLLVVCSLMFWAERGVWNSENREWVREDGKRSPFNSIIEGFYWGITTLATVGYGDVTPITPWGKLVACLAMMLSILTIALPTSVIGSNFMNEWQLYQREQLQRKMRKRDKYRKHLLKIIQNPGGLVPNFGGKKDRDSDNDDDDGLHPSPHSTTFDRENHYQELDEQNTLVLSAIAEIQDRLSDINPPQYFQKYKDLQTKYDDQQKQVDILLAEVQKWRKIAKEVNSKHEKLSDIVKQQNMLQSDSSSQNTKASGQLTFARSSKKQLRQQRSVDFTPSSPVSKQNTKLASKVKDWMVKKQVVNSLKVESPTKGHKKSFSDIGDGQEINLQQSPVMIPKPRSLSDIQLDEDQFEL